MICLQCVLVVDSTARQVRQLTVTVSVTVTLVTCVRTEQVRVLTAARKGGTVTTAHQTVSRERGV